VILFLHNRYRTTGGEERVVEDLRWLVREHLGEDAELLERDSATLGRARAATGLLAGGLAPRDVAEAVRLTGARIVRVRVQRERDAGPGEQRRRRSACRHPLDCTRNAHAHRLVQAMTTQPTRRMR